MFFILMNGKVIPARFYINWLSQIDVDVGQAVWSASILCMANFLLLECWNLEDVKHIRIHQISRQILIRFGTELKRRREEVHFYEGLIEFLCT